MIKRIKGSLFAKVFILTVAVLLCVSFLVYGVLAWYMPQTYSNNLNAALDEQTSDFIYELEHIRMQDIALSFWGVIFTEIPQAMSIMACCIGYFNTVGR